MGIVVRLPFVPPQKRRPSRLRRSGRDITAALVFTNYLFFYLLFQFSHSHTLPLSHSPTLTLSQFLSVNQFDNYGQFGQFGQLVSLVSLVSLVI